MTRDDDRHPVSPPPARARRGDVQGLRAIAVLAVVAGHYGVPWLQGGYLGVDVFFVISGFLITQLLVREVDRTGRFSLRDFYSRRARRILPAATLVTLLTLVGASLWISATDSLRVVTDAVWATFFVANIHFAQVGTDYNQQSLATSPLQHYWSLATEEQFYVVWPLLLLVCLALVRLARARRGAAHDGVARAALPRPVVVTALSVVAVGSFGYDVVRAHADPIATYFSTPARVWELAVGALAALLVPVIARRRRVLLRQALVVLGVGAILASVLGFDETTQSTTAWYALPVLGTAAALLGGAGDGADRLPTMRLLGAAPLRMIGDWSYSLYLWHWPLLILALDHDGDLDAGQRGLLAAVALLLSFLTFSFVEQPFRNPIRFPRPRALALYPASVLVLGLSCGLGSVYAHYRAGEFGNNPAITMSDFGVTDPGDYHFPSDPDVALVHASVIAAEHHMAVPSHLQPRVTDLLTDVPDLGDCDYAVPGNRNLCPRGDLDAGRTLVVLGNSHGRMWIPAVEQLAQREHYTTYYLTKSNCSAADLQFSDTDPATPLEPWADCHDFREWAFSQIARLHPALTIVSTTGPNAVIFDHGVVTPDNPRRGRLIMDGFESTFHRLMPLTDRLVLLRDVPRPGFDPGECLTSAGHDLGDCLFKPAAGAKAEARLSVKAANHLGVDVVDPLDWLCWDDRCPMVVGDTIAFRDSGHLSATYAATLAPELGRALGIWTDTP